MKIGLMGGTFNPIHNAHLRIAENARIFCSLDRIIFIPASDPPHKKLAKSAGFDLRCQMVRLAIRAKPFFELSTIEGDRSGKSYSIDTIHIFQKEAPDSELFFIIGGDSFLEIGMWRSYADIFRSCHLVVFERPGFIIGDPYEALPDIIKAEFHYDANNRRLLHESGHFVQFVPDAQQNISSTEIRRYVASGNNISGFVPPEVSEYISQQRIYNECQ